ncbi:MAG: hypothetical protein ACT4O2_05325, partial [Beijerinckiaceae bacterium]
MPELTEGHPTADITQPQGETAKKFTENLDLAVLCQKEQRPRPPPNVKGDDDGNVPDSSVA